MSASGMSEHPDFIINEIGKLLEHADEEPSTTSPQVSMTLYSDRQPALFK